MLLTTVVVVDEISEIDITAVVNVTITGIDTAIAIVTSVVSVSATAVANIVTIAVITHVIG